MRVVVIYAADLAHEIFRPTSSYQGHVACLPVPGAFSTAVAHIAAARCSCHRGRNYSLSSKHLPMYPKKEADSGSLVPRVWGSENTDWAMFSL